MTYLSKIWLNPLRRGTQEMLRSPQVMHAAVLGGIPAQPVTERVLWRLEPDGSHRAAVLVLSVSRPSWEHLIEQGGWPSADEPQSKVRTYQPLLDQISLGREFRFRLRANPVMATRTLTKPSAAQRCHLGRTDTRRGVRVPHRTAAHQLAWFTGRVDKWGFEIPTTADGFPDVLLAGRERVQFTKRATNGGTGHRVTVQTATFEGRLRVADPELARASLLNGVGAARAYGCGLITLAPPSVVVGG